MDNCINGTDTTESAAKAFFDRLAESWDDNLIVNESIINTMLTKTHFPENAHVLDIACGTGVMFPFYLSFGAEHITGVDLSDGMIKKAKDKFGTNNKIELIAADFLTADLTGFDYAAIYSAYPHFSDKRALAEKVYCSLKAGGRFAVMHSESAEIINKRHVGLSHEISGELLPAKKEAEIWETLFDIDEIIDTNEMYFFSGVKK